LARHQCQTGYKVYRELDPKLEQSRARSEAEVTPSCPPSVSPVRCPKVVWTNFGPTSVRLRSTSVRFRSGFGPVSVRFRSGFGPALGRLFQHAQVATLRPCFGQLRSRFGPVSVRLWPTPVRLCRKYGPTSVQLRSGFGPTLGRLFQHAQGLGEFDVVLDPWPITRILTSPESVVYLIEFISSIIRCD